MERSNGRVGLAIQAASLCTTGVVLWLGSSAFRLRRFPLDLVTAQAFLFALVAWLWSAAIAFLLYLATPRQPGEYMILATLRTSAVAVWFAPATILLSHMSPATLLAALALVITATRLLYSEWLLIHPLPEEVVAGPAGFLFNEYPEPVPLFRREFLTAVAVALTLQFAATARMFHHTVTSGALFAMTAAALTLFAMTSGALPVERPRSLPQSLLGIVLTIFLAAAVTIAGLGSHLFRGGDGNADTGSPNAKPVKGATAAAAPSRPAIGPHDGSFPGVILRPETKPFVRLVDPPPVRGPMGIAQPRTYAIPFDGEYWMYRFLYRRPPPRSLEERGSPTEMSFSTVDRWPLVMEAHQGFDPPIDLHCRAIRVEIWNGDRFPNTISLELEALGEHGWQTIGTEPVRSVPLEQGGHVVAAAEALEFPLHADVPGCKELEVIFRRDRSRMHRSAMVSIDRFVLLP